MTPEGTIVHVGEPVDAAWGTLPNGTRTVGEVTRSETGRDEATSAVVVRVADSVGSDGRAGGNESDRTGRNDGTDAGERVAGLAAAPVEIEAVRERYPDARVLAYTVRDRPDAAIDASRLGIEYVSGRRLAADGETLADRIRRAERGNEPDADGGDRVESEEAEPEHDGSGKSEPDREFLEPFVRIISDRSTEFDATVDALLDLGRDHLGLSIGYASRIDGDRIGLRRYRDPVGLVDSLAADDLDADGMVPLELTYCRETVRGAVPGGDADDRDGEREPRSGSDRSGTAAERDGVFSVTDPEAAGLADHPAYERFGVGSYVGGRVLVDEEVFGTICFLDPESRDRPFDASEELFVELLAEWLGRAIERRLAGEQREAAVERFEETLDRIDDGFFALDAEWRFTYVNERAASLLGREPAELVGADVREEFPAALGPEHERHYRRAMAEQEVVSFENYHESLDVWSDVTAYPSPNGLSVFFADVTERKRRERTLERLLGTVEELQRTGDREAVAERLVAAADEVLGYGISGVRLFDADANRLRLAATNGGVGDRFAASRRPRRPGKGITGRAFEYGETRLVDDLVTSGDLADDEERDYHGMRSTVAVPLGDHGVFVVGSTEPESFDERDVTVLELLATNAVAAMDANERRGRLRTYEDALKNVDDMVCVLDEDGVVTYATGPFAAWIESGDPASETPDDGLVGRRLADLVSGGDADRVAEAVDALAAGTAGGERGSDPTRNVSLIRDGDGDRRVRHGELRLSALSSRAGHAGGVVASLSDTTDLRRTRTELSAERDRFRRLFDRIPDPVMEVVLEDDETVIDGLNAAFESQFGVDELALRGRTVAALDIDDEQLGSGRAEGRSLDALVRERGFATEEIRRRTVDGPREFLFLGFSYETDEGRRAFGIYTDITDRKRRERYVRIVNRILRHNLRNELNVVFGFAEEIGERTDDDRIREYARRIETTGKRLSGVAEGAATLRRVIEKGYVTDPEAIEVAGVVEEVIERHASECPDARITADIPRGTTVRGDDRLAIAVDHLVENAVEHGGDAPHVAVTAERNPDAGVMRVSVADDGPGIPSAVREVIAEDREVTQLRHNTGVGLWIAAWVVEAYGGDIRFGPGLGDGGATVTLVLPAAGRGGAER
ncbi:diguanylate cyclase/phosphodiesterase (GGDEF & EAL domains) with PAS/PAC sensor(s) [Halorubrum sp. DM2]|uniref:PAS domain-containing protein n=1 Tax=Halorubrum sp. DM2 TaxID=2527867 RepID=UPI0024B7E434|nr:PAS domain-containing protein [Halorubrum sp. DM2]VTT87228.1 diguanylate cyclase/phosphodiesterase (GGDEF & EAL domains) with PAS/PAC sensor(s) [Halorubrum sp. DM2]